MIKKYFILIQILFLCSCNGITFQQLYPAIKESIVGVDEIEVDQEFIASREFSFIKLSISNDVSATLTLVEITNDNVFHWISSDRVKVATYMGKIIKVQGTDYDFQILNFRNWNCNKNSESQVTSRIFLFEPEAYLDLENNLVFEDDVCYEKYKSNQIRFKGTNQYSYFDNSLPKQTIQKVHPNQKILKLDFYYK